MQSSSFLDFIRADGIYHFSLQITNIFKPQGTKFPFCYKRILESWIDPHLEEDRVKTTDSAASLPFAPLMPGVKNGLEFGILSEVPKILEYCICL